MKILGVGLSRTGTLSLHHAMEILGFTSIHHDIKRMKDIILGNNVCPNFKIYNDIDAVSDLPSAYFFRELLEAYPDAKAILTIRNTDKWWRSIEKHFNQNYVAKKKNLLNNLSLSSEKSRSEKLVKKELLEFKTKLRYLVYGSTKATEYLYKKKYEEHNLFVQKIISSDRLLVIDITQGNQWEKICAFLNKPIPNVSFPHKNQTS